MPSGTRCRSRCRCGSSGTRRRVRRDLGDIDCWCKALIVGGICLVSGFTAGKIYTKTYALSGLRSNVDNEALATARGDEGFTRDDIEENFCPRGGSCKLSPILTSSNSPNTGSLKYGAKVGGGVSFSGTEENEKRSKIANPDRVPGLTISETMSKGFMRDTTMPPHLQDLSAEEYETFKNLLKSLKTGDKSPCGCIIQGESCECTKDCFKEGCDTDLCQELGLVMDPNRANEGEQALSKSGKSFTGAKSNLSKYGKDATDPTSSVSKYGQDTTDAKSSGSQYGKGLSDAKSSLPKSARLGLETRDGLSTRSSEQNDNVKIYDYDTENADDFDEGNTRSYADSYKGGPYGADDDFKSSAHSNDGGVPITCPCKYRKSSYDFRKRNCVPCSRRISGPGLFDKRFPQNRQYYDHGNRGSLICKDSSYRRGYEQDKYRFYPGNRYCSNKIPYVSCYKPRPCLCDCGALANRQKKYRRKNFFNPPSDLKWRRSFVEKQLNCSCPKSKQSPRQIDSIDDAIKRRRPFKPI